MMVTIRGSTVRSPTCPTSRSKPMAGAVTAALFLRRFVPAGTAWAHLDLYAWNDANRPGRPEGGEAQGARALHAMIADMAREHHLAASS